MTKTSWFRFIGELHPKDAIPLSQARYTLNRPTGSMSIDITGATVSVEFVISFESFDELYAETVEFVQAFIAVQALKTWFPIQLVFTEWIETPLEPVSSDGVSHPVRGRILRENPDQVALPPDTLTFALAEGIRWSEDLELNPFLRRAVLDFNYALQHPINDIPIYLYRAIDSAQAYCGGERELIKALNVGEQVKKVKRRANEGQAGVHVRHAAKTANIRKLSLEDVAEATKATGEILVAFQMETLSKRLQGQQ